MKKLLIILSLLVACTKPNIPTPLPPPTVKDIFATPQSTVSNGDNIYFNLKSPGTGTYTLTMFDSVTTQVITRERFKGKNGLNNLKIYTSSLPIKYLYLVLMDSANTQIGKTTLIIN
jgi:hypothetical protein